MEGHSQRQNVLNRMIMQTAIKGNASKTDPQGGQTGEVVVAIYHHQLRAECGKEKILVAIGSEREHIGVGKSETTANGKI